MARRYRRYKRYRRKYRSRRKRYYGKKKAAAQQRQKGRFVIKSTQYGYIQIDPYGFVDQNRTQPNYGGTAAISCYKNLLASNYFASLVKMYDQFRLDSCKIRIVPTQSVLLQGQKQSLFISAIDRNGLTTPSKCPSFSEIASYSSAFQKAINLDASTWSTARKVYASTIQEKGFYIPTSQIQTQEGAPITQDGANIFDGQQISVPWNPHFLIGVMCMATSPATDGIANVAARGVFPNVQTWNYMMQFEWCVTFRGLRYDNPQAAAPIVNVNSIINPTGAINTGKYTTQPTNPPTDAPSIIAPTTQSATAPVVNATNYTIVGLQLLITPPIGGINTILPQINWLDSIPRADKRTGDSNFPTVLCPMYFTDLWIVACRDGADANYVHIYYLTHQGIVSNVNWPASSLGGRAVRWCRIGINSVTSRTYDYTVTCRSEQGVGYTYPISVPVSSTAINSDRIQQMTVVNVQGQQHIYLTFQSPTAQQSNILDIFPSNPSTVAAQAAPGEGLVPTQILEDDENFDPDPTII